MRRFASLTLLIAVPVSAFFAGITTAADEPVQVIVPQEIDDLLANPGIGWETFHHTADADPNLPAWIPSTVHYARWGWGTLEPKPGELDTVMLDDVLRQTHTAGQKLAFRVMCCSSSPRQPYHPAWLQEMGGQVVKTRYGTGPELEVPLLDDPQVLAAHLDFIRRLGARYDGHADIDHIDLGSVGWWGEWHMSESTNAPMPTVETQKKIVDAYFEAFTQTPLVMLIGGGKMLTYATQKGAGWRADCLGDMGGFSRNWCHMRKGYPKMLPEAGAVDNWKAAPVAWETCWDMRKWVEEGWSIRYIFNYALALHGSVINNKSAPLPPGSDVQQEVQRFLRRLGYRFVLRRLEHATAAQPGDSLAVKMQWQNIGSAPCYQPYRLAYRLTDSQGDRWTIVSGKTVKDWMPGSVDPFTPEFLEMPPDLPLGDVLQVTDTLKLPRELAAGDYQLAIGIVGTNDDEPKVRIAIAGRDPDGWYPLSQLTIRTRQENR